MVHKVGISLNWAKYIHFVILQIAENRVEFMKYYLGGKYAKFFKFYIHLSIKYLYFFLNAKYVGWHR